MTKSICGWCGKVDEQYIENCITTDCAMKPVTRDTDRAESDIESALGYSALDTSTNALL